MGGLGSWSVTNMVLAHLMEEARARGPRAPNLGAALLGFFRRFSGAAGAPFDYNWHVRFGVCMGVARWWVFFQAGAGSPPPPAAETALAYASPRAAGRLRRARRLCRARPAAGRPQVCAARRVPGHGGPPHR
jgi:hypothetical protein